MAAATVKASKAPSNRGRPSAKRAAELDRLILDTARRKFLSDSFDGVALEAIAAEAGVSKGTLYARHSSKEDLFLAVWGDAVRRWSEAASREDYLLNDNIEERLRHHGHTIAESLLDEETLAFQRFIFANAPRFPTIAREIHHIGFRYIADVVARDMAQAGAREGMAPKNPAKTAEAFVVAISGWMTQQQLLGRVTHAQAHDQVEHVLSVFLGGRAKW